MSNRTLVVVLFVAVLLSTLFIRIPLPNGGYFNFGDVGVIFAGLLIGSKLANKISNLALGGLIGGLGSATADLIGGFVMFAPITLVVKSLEGLLATLAGQASSPALRALYLFLAGLFLVGGYFLGEWMLPTYGLPGAMAELAPNAIQAIGGIVGGSVLFKIYSLIESEPTGEP